nr:endoplasmic reticulum membrane sensor NFE2L1 isoform X1 [Nothobranchius furzeri]
MSEVCGGSEGLDVQTSDQESPADLELRWQDLLDLLQSENTDVGPPRAFERISDSGTPGMFGGAGTQSHQQHSQAACTCSPTERFYNQQHYGDTIPAGFQIRCSSPWCVLGSENQSLQSTLLLTPSAELEDHSPEDIRTTLGTSNMDSLQPSAILFGRPEENVVLGLDGDDIFTMSDLSPLTQDFINRAEADSCEVPAGTPTLKSDRTFLCEEDTDDLTRPLSELLENSNMLEDIRLLDVALDEGLIPEVMTRLEEDVPLHDDTDVRELGKTDGEDELDSDSGLSLDSSHSPASSCVSGSSAQYSFTSTSSNFSCCASAVDDLFSEDESKGSDPGGGVTVKLEERAAEAVGRWEVVRNLSQTSFGNERFHSYSWMEHIVHDHTYSQGLSSAGSQRNPRQTKSTLKHGRTPYRHVSGTSRDECRARTFKIPFSNELIVHLPVEAFNDLLIHYQLADEQLALIRDIRRRGKNKIAAHNCRKRKQDVLLGLESEVSSLRRRHSQLLRERWKVIRLMSKIKQRLGLLSQEVFCNLRDEEGRLLDAAANTLLFVPEGGEAVASDNSNKQRDEKLRPTYLLWDK